MYLQNIILLPIQVIMSIPTNMISRKHKDIQINNFFSKTICLNKLWAQIIKFLFI